MIHRRSPWQDICSLGKALWWYLRCYMHHIGWVEGTICLSFSFFPPSSSHEGLHLESKLTWAISILRIVFSAEAGWDMVMMGILFRERKRIPFEGGCQRALGVEDCSKGGWEGQRRSNGWVEWGQESTLWQRADDRTNENRRKNNTNWI